MKKVILLTALLSMANVFGEANMPVPISMFPFAYNRIAAENGITFKEAVKLCRELGVDGFDACFTDSHLDDYVAAGLRPCELYGRMKFLGPDNGRAESQKFVEAAVRIGAKQIMMLPDHFTGGRPSEAELAKILSGITILLDIAAAKGVVVMTEPFGYPENPASYLRYLKRMLDHDPRLMLSMDTGNLYCVDRGDDICELATYAADRVRLMHLKDMASRCKGDPERYVTIGLGAVPNERIVRFMNRRGYKGWYTLENPIPGDTLGDVKRQLAILKHWLSTPERPSRNTKKTPAGK